MRSIEANYKKIQARNVNLGSYLCLSEAIKGKSFSRKSLIKAFNGLIPENEYSKEERKGLIDYLVLITKPSEEGEI